MRFAIVTAINKTAIAAAAIENGVAKTVHEAAVSIREDIWEQMQAPKHGIVYHIEGRDHQASAPGEAPAVLTADLINSVREEQVDKTTWDIPAEGQEGQQMWEYGMRGPATERPYLRPAADAARKKYGNQIKVGISDALGRI